MPRRKRLRGEPLSGYRRKLRIVQITLAIILPLLIGLLFYLVYHWSTPGP